MKKLFALLCFISCLVYGQEEIDQPQSNIQTYTPTKLLSQGQWDIKWFNNLYTEVKRKDKNGDKINFPRKNFFTSSLDVFTGVSSDNRLNVGLLLEYRSNTILGKNILAPFGFSTQTYRRNGLSSMLRRSNSRLSKAGRVLRSRPLLVFPYLRMKQRAASF